MSTTEIIILVVVLFLVFGGGGGYWWSRRGQARHSSHYFDAEIHNNLNREMKRGTHEKFENISQSSGGNRLHTTVAVRRSDSYFDFDISGAWLHIIRAKLYYKCEIL